MAAIYGANASGKSNVLGALGFLRDAITDSQRLWPIDGTPHDPFRLFGKASEPSLYEVDVVIEGVRYRYGFQLSASRIEEEWLFTWPHGRKAMWFERSGERFEFGKTLHGENDAIRALTRPNSLFCLPRHRTTIWRCFHCRDTLRAGDYRYRETPICILRTWSRGGWRRMQIARIDTRSCNSSAKRISV